MRCTAMLWLDGRDWTWPFKAFGFVLYAVCGYVVFIAGLFRAEDSVAWYDGLNNGNWAFQS